MKAAVMRANNAPLELEDVTIDDPGPGEVLLKTAASGVCHSDLSVIEGGIPVPAPCVLGHEPAGIVEKVGAGVTGFQEGDHVIGCLSSFCGECKFCLGGRPYLCAAQAAGRSPEAPARITDADGNPVAQMANLASFAEKMLCGESGLVKIREDMPLDRACLIGCGVTTGLGAVLNTADVRAGDTVVIVGCGGVGLAAVQGARIRGAGKIIAIDAQDWKAEVAQQMGATHFVNGTTDTAMQEVMDLTGGGADYAFECIGLVPTVQQAIDMTGRGGTTVLVGVVPLQQTVAFNAGLLTLSEKRIQGSFMGSNRFRFDMPKYIDFYLDGRLKLDEMISARIPLDAVNDSFDRMRAGEVARQVIVFE